MFFAVLIICEDDTGTLETLPNFTTYFLEFKANLQKISTLAEKQKRDP